MKDIKRINKCLLPFTVYTQIGHLHSRSPLNFRSVIEQEKVMNDGKCLCNFIVQCSLTVLSLWIELIPITMDIVLPYFYGII